MRRLRLSVSVFVAILAFARAPAQEIPLGGEFQANTYTTGEQRDPRIAPLPNGGFVVVWASYGQDGDETGIFGQRFDGTGQKDGPEFQINTYTTGVQKAPDVSADAQGNFVVVWEDFSEDGDVGVAVGEFDGVAVGVGVLVTEPRERYRRISSIAASSRGSDMRVGEYLLTTPFRSTNTNVGVAETP